MKRAGKWIVSALGVGDAEGLGEFGHITDVSIWLMEQS
jgi:hypothetical protein